MTSSDRLVFRRLAGDSSDDESDDTAAPYAPMEFAAAPSPTVKSRCTLPPSALAMEARDALVPNTSILTRQRFVLTGHGRPPTLNSQRKNIRVFGGEALLGCRNLRATVSPSGTVEIPTSPHVAGKESSPIKRPGSAAVSKCVLSVAHSPAALYHRPASALTFDGTDASNVDDHHGMTGTPPLVLEIVHSRPPIVNHRGKDLDSRSASALGLISKETEAASEPSEVFTVHTDLRTSFLPTTHYHSTGMHLAPHASPSSVGSSPLPQHHHHPQHHQHPSPGKVVGPTAAAAVYHPHYGERLRGIGDGAVKVTFPNGFYEFIGQYDRATGKRHGMGTLLGKDGSVVSGWFHQGECSTALAPASAGPQAAVGYRRWADGSTYEGDLQEGEAHGHGTYISALRHGTYVGEWRFGKKQGRGVWTSEPQPVVGPSGSEVGVTTYEGEWVNDKFHGRGVLSSHDRWIVGTFEFGHAEGAHCFIKYAPSASTSTAEVVGGHSVVPALSGAADLTDKGPEFVEGGDVYRGAMKDGVEDGPFELFETSASPPSQQQQPEPQLPAPAPMVPSLMVATGVIPEMTQFPTLMSPDSLDDPLSMYSPPKVPQLTLNNIPMMMKSTTAVTTGGGGGGGKPPLPTKLIYRNGRMERGKRKEIAACLALTYFGTRPQGEPLAHAIVTGVAPGVVLFEHVFKKPSPVETKLAVDDSQQPSTPTLAVTSGDDVEEIPSFPSAGSVGSGAAATKAAKKPFTSIRQVLSFEHASGYHSTVAGKLVVPSGALKRHSGSGSGSGAEHDPPLIGGLVDETERDGGHGEHAAVGDLSCVGSAASSTHSVEQMSPREKPQVNKGTERSGVFGTVLKSKLLVAAGQTKALPQFASIGRVMMESGKASSKKVESIVLPPPPPPPLPPMPSFERPLVVPFGETLYFSVVTAGYEAPPVVAPPPVDIPPPRLEEPKKGNLNTKSKKVFLIPETMAPSASMTRDPARLQHSQSDYFSSPASPARSRAGSSAAASVTEVPVDPCFLPSTPGVTPYFTECGRGVTLYVFRVDTNLMPLAVAAKNAAILINPPVVSSLSGLQQQQQQQQQDAAVPMTGRSAAPMTGRSTMGGAGGDWETESVRSLQTTEAEIKMMSASGKNSSSVNNLIGGRRSTFRDKFSKKMSYAGGSTVESTFGGAGGGKALSAPMVKMAKGITAATMVDVAAITAAMSRQQMTKSTLMQRKMMDRNAGGAAGEGQAMMVTMTEAIESLKYHISRVRPARRDGVSSLALLGGTTPTTTTIAPTPTARANLSRSTLHRPGSMRNMIGSPSNRPSIAPSAAASIIGTDVILDGIGDASWTDDENEQEDGGLPDASSSQVDGPSARGGRGMSGPVQVPKQSIISTTTENGIAHFSINLSMLPKEEQLRLMLEAERDKVNVQGVFSKLLCGHFLLVVKFDSDWVAVQPGRPLEAHPTRLLVVPIQVPVPVMNDGGSKKK